MAHVDVVDQSIRGVETVDFDLPFYCYEHMPFVFFATFLQSGMLGLVHRLGVLD